MKMRRILKVFGSILLTGAFFPIGIASAAVDTPSSSKQQWIIYLGALGGYYNGTFQYESHYVNNRNPFQTQIDNGEIDQPGLTTGGQMGVQYHAAKPYYVGLVFGAMANSKRAVYDSVNLAAGENLQTALRITANFDLAVVFGIDITSDTHIYFKGGPSFARLLDTFTQSVQAVGGIVGTGTMFQRTDRYHLWGSVVGIGLTRDLGRWVSLFGEYDMYNYGTQELATYTNLIGQIDPGIGEHSDYFQEANNIRAYAIRAGINLNFAV